MRKIITISTHVRFKQDATICFYLIQCIKQEFLKCSTHFNDLGIFHLTSYTQEIGNK